MSDVFALALTTSGKGVAEVIESFGYKTKAKRKVQTGVSQSGPTRFDCASPVRILGNTILGAPRWTTCGFFVLIYSGSQEAKALQGWT